MLKEAVVLAGGLGTRLRNVVQDLPKPMAPVNGKPFLEYVLAYLELYGIKKVVLSVGYKHELIKEHFGDKFRYMQIDYAIEEEPLGTGGAICLAAEKLESDRFMVLNGDTLFKANLGKLQDYHRIFGAELTMVLRQVQDVSRYGAVEVNPGGRIIGFSEKSEAKGKGSINGGIYLMNRSLLSGFEPGQKFSFEKDVLQKKFEDHAFFGMSCKQYFIDIGIPEDFKRANEEFKEFADEF